MSLIDLQDKELAKILICVADNPKTFKSLAFTCKRLLTIAKDVVKDLPHPMRDHYIIDIDQEEMMPRADDDEKCPIHEDGKDRDCHHHELLRVVRSNSIIAASIGFVRMDLYFTNCFMASSFMNAENSILDRLTGLRLWGVSIDAGTFILLISKLKNLKYLETTMMTVYTLKPGAPHRPCPLETRRVLEQISFGEDDSLLVDSRLDLPAKKVKIEIGSEKGKLPVAYLKKYKNFIEHITVDTWIDYLNRYWGSVMKKNGLDKIKYKVRGAYGPEKVLIRNYDGDDPSDEE